MLIIRIVELFQMASIVTYMYSKGLGMHFGDITVMEAREVDEEDNFCSREVSIVAELFSFDKACINVSHSATSDSGLVSSAICIRISSTSCLTRAILCSSVSSCDSISCLEVRYDCFRFLAINVSEKSRQHTDIVGQGTCVFCVNALICKSSSRGLD